MNVLISARAVRCLLIGCWIAASCEAAHAGEDNRQQKAEQVRRSWSSEVRLALEFEETSQWHGGRHVTSPRKSGGGALKWDRHIKNSMLECQTVPHDLSAFNIVSFWLHSNLASDETFMIILPSTGQTKKNSYYSHKVTVDWEGWKKIELHFRSFGRARSPAGWDKIDRIRLAAAGWNQYPTDQTVWVLDQIEFRYSSEPYRPTITAKQYVAAPDRTEYLARLRPDHPRLILLDEDLPALKQFIKNDDRGRAWYQAAKAEAERLYRRPVRKHVLPDGRRLLSISRDEVNRMYHWGFFYRLEGDRKWLDRAWRELEAIVAFPDWNPSHYLDTAEMMHATAIGYDWFYHGLTERQRQTIRDGLWQHGLRLSHAAYMGLEAEGMQGWRQVTNNWNFVCNGGSSLAAMAVLEDQPGPCTEILDQGFQYIQIPLEHFEPDGAWWEGVGYWSYAMRYFVPYLRGMETAFGTDFGFVAGLKGTGFDKAGDFPVYLVSPLGGIYNFADSGSGGGRFEHPYLFYLGSRFHRPLYRYFQEQQTSGGLTDLLYYEPLAASATVDDLPLDRHFRGTEVATMRGSWTDRDTSFVGIKCGKNGIAHAHQDLGSYIFYALGEKWLVDLGTEHQTYLGHQHHLPRSHFYRIREEGHNLLVFNPSDAYCQDGKGSAVIERMESSPDQALAVADLTNAYRRDALSVKRGYRLFANRTALLVQDEFTARKPSDVWWFAHGDRNTDYSVNQDGTIVTMRRGGKRCRAELLSPSNARFLVVDAAPLPSSPNPSIQDPNDGFQKLTIHLQQVEQATIAVQFVPQEGPSEAPHSKARVSPLADWSL